MLKKTLKVGCLMLIAGFLLIQFFAIDKSQPPISENETLESAINVPADISQLLGRSCNDCHSHKTVYPWYSNVQPFGWFLQGHIDDGRKELNFSLFNTYSDGKKSTKLGDICEEVKAHLMPLPSYLWIHRDAVLSESDRRAICDWAENERTGFQ